MASKTKSRSVTIKNRLGEIDHVLQVVEAFGKQHRISEDVLYAITLSLDEILTNIISYGYSDSRVHDIAVHLGFDDVGDIFARVEDDARPFDPLQTKEAPVEAPIEQRPIGGLGIHLARNMMDHMEYKHEAGKNILLLKKKF